MAKKGNTAQVTKCCNVPLYFRFNDRVLSPLEHITQLCLSIRRTEHDFTHGYNVDELQKVYIRAETTVLNIKVSYDTIMELIQKVDIKDYGILHEILSILNSWRPATVLHRKMDNVLYDKNDRKENLYHMINYISHTCGIIDKYSAYMDITLKKIREADIEKLDIKGSRICTMKPYWYDWYKNHIQDYSNYKSGMDYSNTWRERTEWEKNGYNKNPCEIECKNHNLKIGMSFGSKQKIEITNITKRNSLSNLEYELLEDNGKTEYDYEAELIVIKHIGSLNDGELQIMSIYELKEYAESISLRSIYKHFRF